MGRRASGSVYFEGGRWKARITLPDGKRRTVILPHGLSEEQAREEALRMSAVVRLHPIDDTGERVPAAEETVAQYVARFWAYKSGRGQTTARDSYGRLRKWVVPVLADTPIAAVTRSDLERVVRHLDAAVASGAISAKTAANVWGDVTGMFGQAHKSKVPELQVRADDPTRDVAPPDAGTEKAKPVLFPDELVKLLQCDQVPVQRRRLYALAVYFGARANELAALRTTDVDLEHGTVTIERQRDRRTDGDRATKTKRVRVTDIEPAVLPLVEAMVKATKRGERILPGDDMPTDEMRATTLRADLLTAGVLREALHTSTPERLHLWFHHLRDTGLTWMAVRGDDPLRIQWRGGHTDFKTTQRYIAQGRLLAMGGAFRRVGPFPEIPPCILPRQDSQQLDNPGERVASPTGFEAVGGVARGKNMPESVGSPERDGTESYDSAADSAAWARRYDLAPEDAARVARDVRIAAGLRRCVVLAEEQDEEATMTEMLAVAEGLGWGR